MGNLLVALLSLCVAFGPTAGASQPRTTQEQVLDRIVAHVEDDIVFESELRELGQFQQFTGRAKEDDASLLDRLTDQWIVNTEAASAHFPAPPDAEVEHEIAGMKKQFEKQFQSPDAFEKRMQEAGLSEAQVQRLVKRQLFLTRYLDYKFRAAIQIPRSEIEKYYRETLAPQLAARGQPVPPLPQVEDEIRELLVEREINLRADRWLQDTRAHLRIERKLDAK